MNKTTRFLSPKFLSLSSLKMAFQMHRSDSCIAFDGFFHPDNSNPAQLFDELFTSMDTAVAGDFLAHNPTPVIKPDSDWLDELISGESAPNSPEHIFEPSSPNSSFGSSQNAPDFAVDSPMSAYSTLSQDSLSPDTPTYENTPIIRQKTENSPILAQVKNVQVASVSLSELKAMLGNVDQIQDSNGQVIYLIDASPANVKSEPIPMIVDEIQQKRPVEVKAKVQRVKKLDQNRKASKKYREKIRSKESQLADEIKEMETLKHALEIAVAKVKSHNDCLADQIKRKFSKFL